MDTKYKIEQFFRQYETRTNNALQGKINVEETAAAFSECFIEASPQGVMCGKNDKEFHSSIKKGFEFYRSIGTRSMDILASRVTALDDIHYMAEIQWRASYSKKDASNEIIEFQVIYFLQLLNGKFKVFAYIAGDEQKALKEKGLI